MAGLALATGHPLRGLLLLPLVLVLQVMFVCGVAWPLSLANLVLRDIQQVLTFLCTALMMVEPDRLYVGLAPGPLKLLVYLNPLSYFILTYRSLILHAVAAREYLTDYAGPRWRLSARFPPLPTAKLAFWDYA